MKKNNEETRGLFYGMSKEEARREQFKHELGFIFVVVLLLIAYIKFGNVSPLGVLYIVLVIGVFLCIILDYILYLISGRNIIFKRDWMNEEDEVRREEVYREEARRESKSVFNIQLATFIFACVALLIVVCIALMDRADMGRVIAHLNIPSVSLGIFIIIGAVLLHYQMKEWEGRK